jgi:hypothetical protein
VVLIFTNNDSYLFIYMNIYVNFINSISCELNTPVDLSSESVFIISGSEESACCFVI